MAFNNVLNSLFGRDEDDEAYDMNDIIIRNLVAENMTIFIKLLNLSN